MGRKLKKVESLMEVEAFHKVLYWFFAYPNTKLGLSDLSKQLRISKTTANRIITQLVEEEFLNKEVLGKVWRISCNLRHPYNLTRKIGYNLILVYESMVLEKIRKQIPNSKSIILFGSYRKGDDNEKSDIDLAVEVVDDEDVEIKELETIPQLGYRKNVKVNMHIFSRNRINLNLFANIANGIILQGFLEVKP